MIITTPPKPAAVVAALQRLAVDYNLAAQLVSRLIVKSLARDSVHAVFLEDSGRFVVAPATRNGFRIPLGHKDPCYLALIKAGRVVWDHDLIEGLQMAANIFACCEAPCRRKTRREIVEAKRRRIEHEKCKAALIEFAKAFRPETARLTPTTEMRADAVAS